MVSQSSENQRSTSIDGIEVKLSLAEIQVGALVGIQRQIREVQKNGTFMLEKYISKIMTLASMDSGAIRLRVPLVK